MPEPLELNEMLQGRKILGVEPGRTPGWMVLNLELKAEEREAQSDLRLFLTVFIGGRKGFSDANHFSTSALHYKGAGGPSTVHVIRDGRDPEMPMSSASQSLGDTRLSPKSEPPTRPVHELQLATSTPEQKEEKQMKCSEDDPMSKDSPTSIAQQHAALESAPMQTPADAALAQGRRNDQQLEPEQAAAKAALFAECEKLASAGVTLVAVHFDGVGDDGVIEPVACYDSEGYDFERKPLEIDASHLQHHFDALVPCGFEIDAGGHGDVVLNVKARKITVEHIARYEDYTVSTYEV
jgi:hypothetical protein